MIRDNKTWERVLIAFICTMPESEYHSGKGDSALHVSCTAAPPGYPAPPGRTPGRCAGTFCGFVIPARGPMYFSNSDFSKRGYTSGLVRRSSRFPLTWAKVPTRMVSRSMAVPGGGFLHHYCQGDERMEPATFGVFSAHPPDV